MDDAIKVTMNHFSQRGLAQLGTVKYIRKDSGQVTTHFALLANPAVREK